MITPFWGIDDNDGDDDGDDRNLRTSVGGKSIGVDFLQICPSPSSQYSDLPI